MVSKTEEADLSIKLESKLIERLLVRKGLQFPGPTPDFYPPHPSGNGFPSVRKRKPQ
ncbi:MAG: hypothetical protein HYU34_01435 [Candidatus Omnitrophica bacterium]|nr:hypothetical protein [Candidatus Omnitrophota bacterium]